MVEFYETETYAYYGDTEAYIFIAASLPAYLVENVSITQHFLTSGW